MIEFSHGGFLARDASELPEIPLRIESLYLDFETSSNDPKHDSLNPWDKAHCTIIGAAITWDDWQRSCFVPLHILRERREWLKEILLRTRQWVNHNVKYDDHVLFNSDLGMWWDGRRVDTITLAKLIDSDRTFKGGYGLDALALAWLDMDISRYYEAMLPYLKRNGKYFNKDYGKVPKDLLAEYACIDVIANRELHRYCVETMPPEMGELVETEIAITSSLVDMERRGLRIDPDMVQRREFLSKIKMEQIASKLKQRLGYEINPVSPVDCHDVLCNHFGLPVLSWTNTDDENKKSNPSFDADAMAMYEQHPDSPKDVVKMIIDFRKESTMNSLFWEPWQVLHIDGVLHADYNQNVRSGRMSCSSPNEQQLNLEAKTCVLPRDGYSILSQDASQIEYRLIVHYCRDENSIRAYNENPDIDFHQWVADMCFISRSQGKTINFAMAFGQGKRRTIANLVLQDTRDVPVSDKIRNAETVFDTYHKNLSTLRSTSHAAATAARRRGFVFNNHKRRLHLPRNRSHIAFNRIVQSDAADIMKERVVALCEYMRDQDCYLNALVHDDVVTEVPVGSEEHYENEFRKVLESPNVKYSVPIRWTAKWSSESWGACKKREKHENVVLQESTQ